MSAPVAWSLVAVFGMIFAAVVALMLRADREEFRAARDAPTQRLRVVVGWPAAPPDHPLSLHEAHRTMQRHRGCLRENCARKQVAYQVLVEAGHIRPDVSRTR